MPAAPAEPAAETTQDSGDSEDNQPSAGVTTPAATNQPTPATADARRKREDLAPATGRIGPAPAKPGKFPHGGERVEITAPPALAGLLPSVAAPALSLTAPDAKTAKRTAALRKEAAGHLRRRAYSEARAALLAALKLAPGDLEARYELAATHVLDGKHEQGIALLHQLLTAKDCKPCDVYAARIAVDGRWSGAASSRLLHRTIEAWTPQGDYGPEDWDGQECPAGTSRRSKGNLEDNGEAWCQKRNGKRHGPYRSFEFGISLGEGSHVVVGNYRNGKKHGSWSESASYSNYSVDFYVNGSAAGVALAGHENETESRGTLSIAGREVSWVVDEDGEVIELATPTGDKTSVELRWTVDSGFKTLVERSEKRSGKRHGLWVQYHDNGHPARLVTFKNGRRHGRVEYWTDDGKSLGSSTMDDGNGAWIDYSSTGELVARGNYKGRKREGEWTLKGTRYARSKGLFKRGKREGLWTYYAKDGSVAVTGTIRRGKPTGVWKVPKDGGGTNTFVFSSSGKLLEIDGRRVKRKEYFYSPADFASSPIHPVAASDLGGP